MSYWKLGDCFGKCLLIACTNLYVKAAWRWRWMKCCLKAKASLLQTPIACHWHDNSLRLLDVVTFSFLAHRHIFVSPKALLFTKNHHSLPYSVKTQLTFLRWCSVPDLQISSKSLHLTNILNSCFPLQFSILAVSQPCHKLHYEEAPYLVGGYYIGRNHNFSTKTS